MPKKPPAAVSGPCQPGGARESANGRTGMQTNPNAPLFSAETDKQRFDIVLTTVRIATMGPTTSYSCRCLAGFTLE